MSGATAEFRTIGVLIADDSPVCRALLAAIGEAADQGRGVLLVSAESADLVEICDRILVIHPDRPTRELRGADEDAVLDAVYEASTAAPELEKELS